jgi:hypothetical protein
MKYWRLQFFLVSLRYSSTPAPRSAGFEDEDDDEYENEIPGEGP